ncbi:GNAT family N-acetyltransferase [Nocardia asteroides]|uniref:GNAT family N-acetyltransferase n=1 Tax=Nocardia asteroides TaxID=1824 RepID=UPI001E30BDD5|nr:GNAT family protein [Nocardia asteroides]UGT63187.1 GNAT family N-acetyltransferase [Nocardia asteroides]
MLVSDGVIALRPIAVADVPAHLAGADSALIRLWPDLGAEGPATERFADSAVAWETDGPARLFAVTEFPTAELIGLLDIRLARPYLDKGQASIEYGVYPERRGRGLATRAVILGCRYLAALGTVEEAVIRVDPEHTSSVAVARRARFRYSHSATDGDDRVDWYLQAI